MSCRGAHGAQPEVDARHAGQLAMRHPEERPAAGSLGSLQPAAVPTAKERHTPTRKSSTRSAPPPLLRVVSEDRCRSYPLREGRFVVPGGLVIHRVPKGVSVCTVREQQTGNELWELVDARGRRLALLKADTWSHAAMPEGAALLEDTATVRSPARRTQWSKAPVHVVTDRFHSDTHIYTLERRTVGTDWIWSGLELSRRDAYPARPSR